jgi:nucleoside-diphosphate-sugar epimerase
MAGTQAERPLVVVTGASGLIGSNTVRALAPAYRVVGLDRVPPKGRQLPMHFIECNVGEDASVERAFAEFREAYGTRLASCVHLAAYYDFSGEPSELYQEITVEGTRRVLEALDTYDVEQFVFSSSMLVMKPSDDGRSIREDSPLQAEWDYPQSKLDAERVIQRHGLAIPKVILRIAGVYTDRGGSIPITQQIRRIHEKQLQSYLFPGNAEHGQSFVHIDDVVACIEKVIAARNALGPYEVFLVGEPEVMSYADLQDHIGLALHGKEWPTIRIPAPLAKAGAWLQNVLPSEEKAFIKPWMVDLADANYPISIERAEERLGWRPRHRLRATLDKMLAALRADPKRWYEDNDLPYPGD